MSSNISFDSSKACDSWRPWEFLVCLSSEHLLYSVSGILVSSGGFDMGFQRPLRSTALKVVIAERALGAADTQLLILDLNAIRLIKTS